MSVKSFKSVGWDQIAQGARLDREEDSVQDGAWDPPVCRG